MITSFKFCAVISMSAVLGACTSFQTVPDWQSLQAGDNVRVTTAPHGAVINMKVLVVTTDSLQGQAHANPQPTVIPASQIQEVERRRVSVLKTTGLVAGSALVLTAILTAVAVAELSSSL
jgi:hypothetical protein